MCGIAGVLQRSGAGDYAVGKSLLAMALCLQHRGADSAGVAVFGASQPSHIFRSHGLWAQPQATFLTTPRCCRNSVADACTAFNTNVVASPGH
jgi:glutamate synthase domain-containing protein 1